ncbi:uncharacterized protein LOC112590510 isoform X1 [Harpegnathos saltator]|uniref:uncharacterized protein LOC112590510 isoform X1 n=1 Tax=Harpegnathos saltator TaxID=610380 RepID=UPI000DBEE968|nr:uncharacterized protein LOC112590510 isoform X1 [Harpegnathos saltator]
MNYCPQQRPCDLCILELESFDLNYNFVTDSTEIVNSRRTTQQRVLEMCWLSHHDVKEVAAVKNDAPVEIAVGKEPSIDNDINIIQSLIYERITRPRRRGRPATAAAAAAAAAATAYAPLPSTSQRRRRRGRPSVADAAAAAAATDAATHAATDAAALVATNTAALSCKFC